MTTQEIELAMAKYYELADKRCAIVIPTINYAMGTHEVDLFVVRKSRYVVEIEIKVSKADLLKDLKKKHTHNHIMFRELYFAIPESLMPWIEFIPANAGIFICKQYDNQDREMDNRIFIRKHRDPIINNLSPKISDEQIYKLAKLAALRIWNLRAKLQKGKII